MAAGGVVLLCYLETAAPGYTWAHHGADGGELLAAAATNGVPHPPGYPLYTLSLQALLWIAGWVAPQMELARVGNLFSAGTAATAVALTAWTLYIFAFPSVRTMVNSGNQPATNIWLRTGLAASGGIAFGLTPLLWSQATITEVYALHALWVAVAGVGLVRRFWRVWLILLLGLGLAHHPTSVLLWPALLLSQWRWHAVDTADKNQRAAWWLLCVVVAAVVVGLALHLRTLWAGGWGRDAQFWTPSPVLWGYPDTVGGLLWLLRGTPYQDFVLGVPLAAWPGRLAGALALLIEQYTVIGALLVVVGLAMGVGNGSTGLGRWPVALWSIPTLVYATTYNTVDSYIYLLPVVWLMAIWMARGAGGLIEQPAQIVPNTQAMRRVVQVGVFGVLVAGLSLVIWARFPQYNLHTGIEHAPEPQDAPAYIESVLHTLAQSSGSAPPLLVTRADTHTFALWYAAWGSGELLVVAPRAVMVNAELYTYAWYQRLLHARHPDLQAAGAPLPAFLAANAPAYTIWLTEPLESYLNTNRGELVEPPVEGSVLWRYAPQDATSRP